MDCRSALEILETVCPGSPDLHEPELCEAHAHLEDCARCDETFSARQSLDRRIGKVMRDVAVPAGLLERLYASFDAATPASKPILPSTVDNKLANPELTTPATASSAQGPLFQRRGMRIAAGLAACLAVATAVWMFSGKPAPTLTIDGIGNGVPSADQEIERLQAFDERFAANLPGLGWQSGEVGFDEVIKGFGKARDGGHQMALVRFSYPSQEGDALPGLLVIVPKDEVINADQLQNDFSLGQLGYTDSGDYATVSWATEDLVYVCLVPNNEEARERLKQVLSTIPA